MATSRRATNRYQRKKTVRRKRRSYSHKGRRERQRGGQKQCSPKDKNEMVPNTCLSATALRKLKDKWNSHNSTNQITTDSPIEIHQFLQQHIGTDDNEWITDTSLAKKYFGSGNDNLENDVFAPEAPTSWAKNPNEWLSSDEILDVMKQYEKAYKCFDFLGPSPIDFDKKTPSGCVWNELCKFSVKKMQERGKFKIGIIFNTDVHTGGGEHWISMFINLKKGTILYFDSTGDPVPEQIAEFVEKVKQQGLECDPPIHFTYDSTEGIQHQKKNTECGMYSLYFISEMLKDNTSAELMKGKRIPDEEMEKFRKIYFSTDDITPSKK